MSEEPPTSYVRINRDGSTDFVGALATKLFQAQQLRAVLASPLGLQPGTVSARRLLTVVQAFTGHRYAPYERYRALDDLDDWIRGYELIVPVFEETA